MSVLFRSAVAPKESIVIWNIGIFTDSVAFFSEVVGIFIGITWEC